MAAWPSSNGVTFEGIWPAASATILAAIEQHHDRPLVVVYPLPIDVDTLVPDIEFLLGRSVEVFPQAGDDSELESLLQREVVERLQVLGRLDQYQNKSGNLSNQLVVAPIIVTTLPALMHSVPSPDAIRSSRKLLSIGQNQSIEELRAWLLEAGYHTTTSVQLPGEFTFRGGILDVYPPDSAEPIRMEWFDDEIESIRMFDAVSQKSIERLDRLPFL